MLRLKPALALVSLLSLGSLMSAACSVVVGSDGDFGGAPSSGGKGSGGKGSGGKSGTGGKASGGSAGEASSGGGTGGQGGGAQAKLDCQADGTAEGSYAPPARSSACSECLLTNCGSEFRTCYSVDPDSSCLYGSTSYMVDGGTVEGEFDCMLECFAALVADEDFIGDEVDLESCQMQCGSAECDPELASPVTTDLAACLLGLTTDEDPDGCQAECGL
jgi:hypothetical protein